VGPRVVARQQAAGGTRPQTSDARSQTSDGLDVVQIRPNFHVIGGAGGNIVMQTGPEGVILVDSGSTQNADKVLAAIRRITDLPIRYIINTSMDADHVGGNDKLARAGLSILPGAVVAGAGLNDDVVSNFGRASVLAHENVLTRLTAATGPQALPFALFPTKTFRLQAVRDVSERRRHSGDSHARGAHRRRHDRVLPPWRRDCDRRHHRHDPLARH
jgi:glyoxylase-like metal-dependent hydrolase (beta-lactamase superfamily II)